MLEKRFSFIEHLMIYSRKFSNLMQNSLVSQIFEHKVSKCNAPFNKTKQCKWSISQLFISIVLKYVDTGPNKSLSRCSLANKDNKTAFYVTLKKLCHSYPLNLWWLLYVQKNTQLLILNPT